MVLRYKGNSTAANDYLLHLSPEEKKNVNYLGLLEYIKHQCQLVKGRMDAILLDKGCG